MIEMRAGAKFAIITVAIFASSSGILDAQAPTSALTGEHNPASSSTVPNVYTIGPNDEVVIWVLGLSEISDKPIRVDEHGRLDVPMLGTFQAGGRTVSQLKQELLERAGQFVRQPQVSVSLVEVRSRPVSVVGAVNHPGVFQVDGTKTILDVLSLAGGLTPQAGHPIRLTRRLACQHDVNDSSHGAPSESDQIVDINTKDLVQGKNPEANLRVCPFDVITIPRADLVYVVGEVQKAGAFEMTEGGQISVLQALSLAGGLNRATAAKNARILRSLPDQPERQEIIVNLSEVLEARTRDSTLRAGDILFVPHSALKTGTRKAVDTAIQLAVGIAIFRP